MLKFLKKDTRLGFVLNIAMMLVVFSGLVLLFFFVYLPFSTNHGEMFTVPDVVGKTEGELAEIFKKNSLRYGIEYARHNSQYKERTVISQNPKANSDVKLNRKIYITVNGEPQTVKIPTNIIDLSELNARTQLQSVRLKVGKITKVRSQFKGNVVYLKVNGKKLTRRDIRKGVELKEGEKVDIMIGDGRGNTKEDIMDDDDHIEEGTDGKSP